MAMIETTIRNGRVRGKETETPGVSVFLGIPYAQAAEGALRWHAPVPAKDWEGVRDCLDYGYSCWQTPMSAPPSPDGKPSPVPSNPLRMSEDCLNLNVWTTAEEPGREMPVMVWFYGGGLQRGTADNPTFDGEALCRKGVVLVTVNYRTGVFGYFGHPELEEEDPHHSSGNYGLRDQIEALHWVKANIEAFGGDPDNVMIFGVSGGGRSVQGISCSPLARGLVQHVACHSGGGLNPDYSCPYDKLKEIAAEFIRFCGKESIAQMREIPARELQDLYHRFSDRDYWKQFNITGDGYVLPYTMDEMVRRGYQANIDYILLTTNGEIRRRLKAPVTLENYDQHDFSARNKIFGKVSKPQSDEEASDFAEWAEAYEMKSAQIAWARVQAMQGGQKPAYVCTLDRTIPGKEFPAHGDEKAYIFHTFRKYGYSFTEEDEKVSEEMMSRWAAFARTGDPNTGDYALWTPYTPESPLTLSINETRSEMQDRNLPVMDRCAQAYIDRRRE